MQLSLAYWTVCSTEGGSGENTIEYLYISQQFCVGHGAGPYPTVSTMTPPGLWRMLLQYVLACVLVVSIQGFQSIVNTSFFASFNYILDYSA